MKRRTTRLIHIGNVPVGGSAPITVQSMTNTRTQDAEATLRQINRLADAMDMDLHLQLTPREHQSF